MCSGFVVEDGPLHYPGEWDICNGPFIGLSRGIHIALALHQSQEIEPGIVVQWILLDLLERDKKKRESGQL